jgi:DNA-binding GntR family transcriptional regulator
MQDVTGTELSSQLAAEIARYVRDEGLQAGYQLTERALAERLRVSRSPVRAALLALHRDGVIDRTESGRYLVARQPARPAPASDVHEADFRAEEVYFRVANDVLDGVLPERVTKNALLRRYGLTKAQLDQLLVRISHEGWIAPLPGYGWTFLPVLTSMKSYHDSYRFRLLIEPAGILEPTFRLDRDAVERRRAEQQELVDRGASVPPARLFDLNTRFHETIAACSNNEFLVQSLTRLNRLRRLIEYRQALVPERAVVRCREHVALADLLLAGDRDRACAFLRDHLSTVGAEKTAGGDQPEPHGHGDG